MRRSQFFKAVSSAARAAGTSEVLVIGSQAILGTYDENELPARATLSRELDVAALHDELGVIANRIDVELGEWSPFDQENGFYVQGVEVKTAILPDGWRDRLIRVHIPGSRSVALCLDRHDLCAAKLVRGDPKDLDFVGALVDEGLIDVATLVARADDLPDSEPRKDLAVRRARAYIA